MQQSPVWEGRLGFRRVKLQPHIGIDNRSGLSRDMDCGLDKALQDHLLRTSMSNCDSGLIHQSSTPPNISRRHSTPINFRSERDRSLNNDRSDRHLHWYFRVRFNHRLPLRFEFKHHGHTETCSLGDHSSVHHLRRCRSRMILSNQPKLLIILLSIVCITVLMSLGKLDQSAGTGMLGSIVGYSIGNSVRPKNGEQVPPIISRKKHD